MFTFLWRRTLTILVASTLLVTMPSSLLAQTKSFGNLTHVFSAYEMRVTPDGPVTGRGINSIQLFYDGKRWWIVSAVWDDGRPDNPIPKEFLP